ncbi:MAG: FecR domain-containing protein [Lentisphaeraceae bacterium]|nr:FecR domain-containing protein [Lentisphaeraceae bacterium]
MSDIQAKMEPFLEKIFESGLSNKEQEEFQQLLKTSDEAKQLYLDFCQMHAMLNEESGYLAGNVPDITSKPVIKKFNFAPLYAVAAMLIISGIFLFSKSEPVNNLANDIYRGEYVVTVTKSVGVEFSYTNEGNQPFEVGDLMPAGLYELNKGVIQLNYSNGTRLVVESPAVFELLDKKNIGLRDGKLSALVTNQGKNFTVQCSGVSIIDLGTEFSVYAKKDEYVEAHVFKGLVDVQMHYETGDLNYEVSEGQAVRVLMGATGPVVAGIDLRKEFFLREMSQARDNYSASVLSKNPVIYYPMDISNDGITLNDWSKNKINGLAADVKDVSSLWAAGKVGSAIRLSGSNHKAYVYVEDYPKTTSNKLTVVGWVYAETRPIWATIVKNWGTKKFGQFHFGLNPKGFLDVEIQDGNGERFHTTESSNRFPLRQWQHVAFVHDGTSVKLYRNGVIVALQDVKGIMNPVDLKKMSIGTKLDDNERAPSLASPGHWDGRLDEIAVFNKALSDVDIEELYRLAIQKD